MALPTPFDDKNPDHIKALQSQLNAYNEHSSHHKPLELTGQMDAATKAAWKEFKLVEFTDGKLSANYLKDRHWADDQWFADQGIDPKTMSRDNPPEAVLALVREKLGVGDNAVAFENAVKKDKRKHWVDERINAGALAQVDKAVDRRQAEYAELHQMTGGYDALAKGDFGTGAAVLQEFLAQERQMVVDGQFGMRTRKSFGEYQEAVSKRREAEGLPPLTADAIMGVESFAEMKKDGFDFEKIKAALQEKHPALMNQMEVLDQNREALRDIRDVHERIGGSSGISMREPATAQPNFTVPPMREPNADRPR